MKWPVIHVAADCGGVAFYTTKVWARGELMYAADVTFPDGTKPKPCDLMRCGHCGRPVAPGSHLKFGDPIDEPQ